MSTEINHTTVTINGVSYVRADSVSTPAPNGKRCVKFVDRGWVLAGDVEVRDGRFYLARAVHVQSWKNGLDGLLKDPRSNAVIKKLPTTVDFPVDAELFSHPVSDDWGL